jgi:hypothetical protein
MKTKSLLLTAVATLGLTAATMAQSVPSYVPTNGLVGWWPFNGNANDESGNGNNGTVNGATLSNDRFGNSNKSYLFDGISNRIAFNLNSINNLFPASTESTSSIWIKSTDLNGPLISMQGNNGIEYDFHIGTLADVVQNAGHYGVLVRDNCCGTGNNAFASNCVDNSWHMLTIVRLSNGTLNLYKDAILEFTSASGQNGALAFNSTYMTFGADYSWVIGSQNGCMSCNSNDQQHYSGLLDDVGIWNRGLTQQEITDLFNGCPLSINTQPTNQTININNNAQFLVGSSDPSATFQWQTDLGVGFQNLNSVGQYSGTTNDTLTIANVTMSNNNQPFRCVISSGSCSDTSNVAVLTVNNNVGINEFTQDNLFSVYPNPAQTVINVKVDSKLVGEQYTIIDNFGRVVLSGKIVAEITSIELGNLSNGVYLFRVKDNFNQSSRIVKN